MNPSKVARWYEKVRNWITWYVKICEEPHLRGCSRAVQWEARLIKNDCAFDIWLVLTTHTWKIIKPVVSHVSLIFVIREVTPEKKYLAPIYLLCHLLVFENIGKSQILREGVSYIQLYCAIYSAPCGNDFEYFFVFGDWIECSERNTEMLNMYLDVNLSNFL